MSITQWTVKTTGLQGYMHYPPDWGIPTMATGFPEDFQSESFTLIKDDARPKPKELHISNSTGLSFTINGEQQIVCEIPFSDTLPGYYYQGGIQQYRGSVPFFEMNEAPLISDAASKLFQNVRGKTVDVLSMLGEGPETVAMLSRIVKYAIGFKKNLPRTLSRAFTTHRRTTLTGQVIVDRAGKKLLFDHKKKRFVPIQPGAAEVLIERNGTMSKDLASALLTFDYGIRPLIGDFFNLAQVLSDNLGSKKMYAKGISKDQDRDTVISVNGPWGTSRPFLVERFAEKRVKILAEYWITDPQMHMLSALGITNPVAAGWELIPFSHVVDLVIPFGGWLQSLDALRGIDGWGQICVRTYKSNTYEPEKGSGYSRKYHEERRRDQPTRLVNIRGISLGLPDAKPSQSIRSLMDQIATLRVLRP